jgi:integrative and conjugative element protein (TIGR02256 family)
VLLGWRDGDNLIVVGALGPGPNALHGRTAFLPDHLWQVEKIRKVFSSTAGDLDYLGDWHTHPLGVAVMSGEDRKTLHRICRRAPGSAMAILAGGIQGQWTVAAWRGIQRTRFLSFGFEPADEEVKAFEPPSEWPSLLLPG